MSVTTVSVGQPVTVTVTDDGPVTVQVAQSPVQVISASAQGPQGPAGVPAGPVNAIQYNLDNVTFGGSANFTWDDTTGKFVLVGDTTLGGGITYTTRTVGGNNVLTLTFDGGQSTTLFTVDDSGNVVAAGTVTGTSFSGDPNSGFVQANEIDGVGISAGLPLQAGTLSVLDSTGHQILSVDGSTATASLDSTAAVTWLTVGSAADVGLVRSGSHTLKVTDGGSGSGTLVAGTFSGSGTSLTGVALLGTDNTFTGDLVLNHTSTSQVRHLKLNNADAGGAGGMISGYQGTNEILRLGWHFDGSNWVGSLGLIGSIALMNFRAIGSNVRVSYGPTDLTGSVASQLTIQPGSASDAGLVIRGAASQSASLFAVQDSTGVARMSFDLNNYALVVANTTIALFSLTVPEAYDIRAASFLDFTITNPTLRWPTSSPNVGIKYSGTSGVVKVTDGSTGKGSVSAKAYETQSGSADPTTTDIPSGYSCLWKNTTSGTLKLWANDGGVLRSVALA